MKKILNKILITLLMTSIAFVGQFITVDQTQKDIPDGYSKEAITLPVQIGGGDPWYYKNGDNYYYCYSIGNGVAVKKADSISSLQFAEQHIVYIAPSGTMYSHEYWAPELHFVNGEWYIYVAADNGENINHRMYALKCTTDDPTDTFEFCGQITDSTNKWAIDGTVLQFNDELYFVWSGWKGDEDGEQDLYIAHMSDPLTIDSERFLICEPKLSWERHDMPINEGPEFLIKDDELYLIYSASGSWADHYCLGMLKLTGDNLLDRKSWTKCLFPVFKGNNKVYSPGHCSFVSSPDGSTDYIVYHANGGKGLSYAGRTIRVQKFKWVGNIPFFGKIADTDSQVEIIVK